MKFYTSKPGQGSLLLPLACPAGLSGDHLPSERLGGLDSCPWIPAHLTLCVYTHGESKAWGLAQVMAFTFMRLKWAHFHFCVLHIQGQRLCSKETETLQLDRIPWGSSDHMRDFTQMMKVVRILRQSQHRRNTIHRVTRHSLDHGGTLPPGSLLFLRWEG